MFQCLLYLIVPEKTFFPRKEKETKMTCRPACLYLAAGKNAFWRERGRFFISPGIPHSLTKCVFCILAKGREGRGWVTKWTLLRWRRVRHGSRGGELLFTYFAIAIWVGFASPFSPGSRHKSELSASPSSSSSSDGWMDGNAVSQTFISTRGREEQTSPKGD